MEPLLSASRLSSLLAGRGSVLLLQKGVVLFTGGNLTYWELMVEMPRLTWAQTGLKDKKVQALF